MSGIEWDWIWKGVEGCGGMYCQEVLSTTLSALRLFVLCLSLLPHPLPYTRNLIPFPTLSTVLRSYLPSPTPLTPHPLTLVQSLPFGGCKKSGYDRFAGPEGLRGLCMIRSVCEDLIPFVRNSIPPPMHYPSTGVGHMFAQGLIRMFYSTDIYGKLRGVWMLIKYSVVGGPKKEGEESKKGK